MTFAEERRALYEQKREFEREKEAFARRMELEERRFEQQQKLFDMKVKILEEELVKLADEKRQFEQQKKFYSKVNEYEQEQENAGFGGDFNVVKGDMFFAGVGSRSSLRKRYRNLIKIYHPDNIDGDNNTIQEINREYDQLSKSFGL